MTGYRATLFVGAALVACGSRAPGVPEPDRVRAEDYAERGQRRFDAGDHEGGLRLATRALVVRLAACGYECPEVAYSFVQLGDMRRVVGQEAWARQSYRRALEVLEPHASTQGEWIRATRERLGGE